MIGLIIILVLPFFLLARAFMAFSWNHALYNVAIRESGESQWYLNWNVTDAIWNPRHYTKWTSKQWLKYFDKGE